MRYDSDDETLLLVFKVSTKKKKRFSRLIRAAAKEKERTPGFWRIQKARKFKEIFLLSGCVADSVLQSVEENADACTQKF